MIVDSDGNWNVIDYEWTFDFAIPVKYIKYRSLLNLFNNQSRSRFFPSYTGYESFGINQNAADDYFSIEVNGFQKWIGNARFLSISQIIRKEILNPYKVEQSDYIDVFYDTGKGFNGDEKDVFYQFPITVNARDDLKSLRIDPSNHCCIVKDISIKSENTALSFTTNAYMQKNNAYFFNTTDPQIYVDISGHEKSTFLFEMKVFTLYENCSATIAEQNSTIANLRTNAAELQSKINALHNSKSWKLTKPIRILGKLLRKIYITSN